MKRKTLKLTCCLLVFTGLLSLANAQMPGDVSSDGTINIVDALLVSQYYVGFNCILDVSVADVDRNGTIDIIDALFIAQYVAGVISVFPNLAPTVQPIVRSEPSVPLQPIIAPVCTPCPLITVLGYIYDQNNQPLANAYVEGYTAAEIKTAADGFYAFTRPGVCNIKYQSITVSAFGYQTATQYTVIGACGTVQVDFTMVPAPEQPNKAAGAVWMNPYQLTVAKGQKFTTNCLVNTGNQKLAAYGFEIHYNSGVLMMNSGIGTQCFTVSSNGFLASANINTAGKAMVAGFDVYGKAPGSMFDLFTINWIATNAGLSSLYIQVKHLADNTGATIGNPLGYYSFVRVVDYGDVNNDGKVNILDALMTAQFRWDFSGAYPPGYCVEAGDVNSDGTINIVDALIIARFAVGMIPQLPIA